MKLLDIVWVKASWQGVWHLYKLESGAVTGSKGQEEHSEAPTTGSVDSNAGNGSEYQQLVTEVTATED